MTMKELAEQGITRARRRIWVAQNYIELTAIEGTDGERYCGPWVKLFFLPAGAEDLDCPQTMLFTVWDGADDWEPYDGPLVEPRRGVPVHDAE